MEYQADDHDHCRQKNKTMVSRDNVIIKLVLVIKWVRKVIQNHHQSAIYHLAAITDSTMLSCLAGNSSM